MSSNHLFSELDESNHRPQKTADIRGPKSRGTTDQYEGRRGLHRHEEEDEDGRLDIMEEEGLRDDRRSN